MKNRIWKLIKKKEPPTVPHYAKDIAKNSSPMMIQVDLQAFVEKKFVIDHAWIFEHYKESMTDRPWSLIGAQRRSSYNCEVNFLMAPFGENGFVDFSAAIAVPADMVGIAANQD